MIVTIFVIAGRPYVNITTDFSIWYYFRCDIEKMWKFETLGM